MKWNIEDRDMREFPALVKILDSHEDDVEDLLRWTIYRYDHEVEQVQEIDDPADRRKKAAALAGIDKKSLLYRTLIEQQAVGMEGSKFEESEKLLSLASRIATQFFRAYNYPKWELYCANRDLFGYWMECIREPVGGDLSDDKLIKANELKAKLSKEAGDLLGRQAGISTELSAGDSDADKIIQYVSPEEYAG